MIFDSYLILKRSEYIVKTTRRICIIIGTRPEAIKMAPVIKALRALVTQGCNLDVRVCVTGQHREMLDRALALFDITPEYDLKIMTNAQDLTDVTVKSLTGLREVLKEFSPHLVMVHGDTTTTLSAALAAYYQRIPVAHVEAGLRTGDIYSPWPEEINRRIAANIAAIHFAPTNLARANLEAENVRSSAIYVTGNTVVDALLQTAKRLDADDVLKDRCRSQFSYLDPRKKLILVTGHRRENFGEGFESICQSLIKISERDDVEIVYPVHMNPNVREPVNRLIGNRKSVFLIEPQDYVQFVYLMSHAYLVLTDSGGIQEEAPSLGKPVLVMRETTERPEGLTAGTVRLVGTDQELIVKETFTMLDHKGRYEEMVRAVNPYGDGHASERIADIAVNWLS